MGTVQVDRLKALRGQASMIIQQASSLIEPKIVETEKIVNGLI